MNEQLPNIETLEESAVPSPEGSLSPPHEETMITTMDPLPKEAHIDEAMNAHQNFEAYAKLFGEALEVFPGAKRQVLRSWMNSAVNPLNKGPLQWSYEGEKELFDIYTEMESAKFILMVHGLQEAGILTLHKPLMQSTATTTSEVELRKQMTELAAGPELDLGKRELPPDQL
jgi:hypothetical protein